MKYAAAIAAFAGAAIAMPAGVSETLTPTASAPASCQPTHSGDFSISIVNATTGTSVTKRSITKRQDESGGPANNALVLSLADGILTDQLGRTGYIASNHQLQFDKPPQAGSIYTAGFSACSNGSLALGDSAVFYGCQSGEGAGKFYNFYDENITPKLCSPIYINIIKSGSSSESDGGASQRSDGQPAATSAVSIRSDGQPIATSAATPVSIRSDGQPIATAEPTPVSIRSDGQPVATPEPTPVSIRSDGQPIATPEPEPTAVSIRSDGQPIATPEPEPTPVSIRSDGQPIATPEPTPVSIRSDGQPIATPEPTPVSIRSDGQPIATPEPTPVSIRSDGQPIATPAASSFVIATPSTPTPTPTPQAYTGAAAPVGMWGSGFAMVGAVAVAVAVL